MEVYISEHAINRCRERLFDYNSSKQTIIDRLKEAAIKGQEVHMRPSSWGNCIELCFRGIFIVMVKNKDKAIVITCLGDSSYRRWVKKQVMYPKVRRRILFPEARNN